MFKKQIHANLRGITVEKVEKTISFQSVFSTRLNVVIMQNNSFLP